MNVKFENFAPKLTNLSFNLDLPTSSPTPQNYSKSLDALRVMKVSACDLASLGNSAWVVDITSLISSRNEEKNDHPSFFTEIGVAVATYSRFNL